MEKKNITAVYVSVSKSGSLFCKVGVLDVPSDVDLTASALTVFSAARKANLQDIPVSFDTIPSPSVDQIVVLSGCAGPDVLVLDAREFGIPVTYSALATIKSCHPDIIFSIAPPGHDTVQDSVDHYMRFVQLFGTLGYHVVAIPDKYTYVLTYGDEVHNAS